MRSALRSRFNRGLRTLFVGLGGLVANRLPPALLAQQRPKRGVIIFGEFRTRDRKPGEQRRAVHQMLGEDEWLAGPRLLCQQCKRPTSFDHRGLALNRIGKGSCEPHGKRLRI